MPAELETKRLQMQTGDMDNAKGHGRYEKHIRQNASSEVNAAGLLTVFDMLTLY